MKCPKCGKSWGTTVHKTYYCYECGEDTPVPPTNEEWFCSLSTEEKAKAMVEVSTRDSLITKRYYEYLLKEITEWLKQPHPNE